MNMPNRSQPKSEWVAISIAIGSLALGFIVVWLARTVIESIDGSVLIALILLPLLVYLSASGKLAEFKAPGGIEAKFAQAAAESVSPASETVAYDDPQVVAKEGVESDDAIVGTLRRGLLERRDSCHVFHGSYIMNTALEKHDAQLS